MLDVAAVITLLILFPVCALYVRGCARLKGER